MSDKGSPLFTFAEETRPAARIKVIGIGGAGGNAVNRMIQARIVGVDFIAANTDWQALKANPAPTKLQLGEKLTKGLGAGANPEIGKQAALEDTDKILEVLDGADMVFITTGLGGGTGTGAAPVVAQLAQEIGALTVAIVTKPFWFEGKKRMAAADQGLLELRDCVDTVIEIHNERLLHTIDRATTRSDAFRIADDVLRQAVQGISDIITVPGFINVDFADVKTVVLGMGMALMGTGVSRGENRAVEAAQSAISSPLLEEASIQGARGVLINVTGGKDLTLHEVRDAVSIISDAADENATIIFGDVLDETMLEEIKITVIATGFDSHNGRNTGKAGGHKAATQPVMPAASKIPVTPPYAQTPAPPTPHYPQSQFTSLPEDFLDVPTFLRRKTD
ncbi:MAG: cell division protein FtsZ [Acidobacteria bacterium]|nr:cell division protein FtsZ [Acidobacteriota bacterium]